MSAFLAMTAEAIRSGSERGRAIATPDQRLRVFVSSTLEELADERRAARDAIQAMRLTPVMFELGARPHAPQNLYRAYLDQSDVFVGIYWQRYGWVGPGMTISGLEEEYRLAGDKPRLLYLKAPAPAREERLAALIAQIESGADASYRIFTTAQELKELIAEDLAVLLTERFDYGVSARSVRMETSLPAAVDSFVGRVREQADLELALQDRSHRLVTITGPGGVGKTRLALEVARRARQAFADGAHYVPLAAISDSDLVLPTIRTSLRVNSSSRPAFEEVVDALHDADLLLVLDNFEQVLTAAPEVTRLLEACPRLSVLVTSRALLRLRGEREFRLAPLNRPAGAGERDDVEASDAGALFLERAQAANPSFTIDGTNRRVVAAICDRLDGLPLALELAAAQVRVLSPTSILQRVDQRLSLGVRPGAAVPDRHQTLRAAIDWSYALLDEAEKRQFRNAGVFRAGWTLDALEAVSAEPALDALASLTEQSLVVPQPVGVDVRFSMLPTIREYARELLDASPESDAIFDRHAEHYARVAAAANLNAGRITPGGQYVDLVVAEQDNIRGALEWSLKGGSIALGLHIAADLEQFWVSHDPQEGIRWFAELHADPRAASAPPEVRPDALRAFGSAAFIAGELERAGRLWEESLAIYDALGDEHGRGVLLHRVGISALQRGELDQGRQMVEESHAIHSAEGDRWGEAQAVGTLGAIARDTGDRSRAYELLSRSAALSHEISVQWWEAGMLAELAALALDAGRVDEAESQATHALVLAAEVRDRAGLIFGVGLLASVAATRRRCHLAPRLWSAVEHEDALAPLGGWRHHRERYAPRLAQCAEMQDDDAAPATLDEAVALILPELPRR